MRKPLRVLVLWNQTDEDVYEQFKADGPKPLPWNPEQTASEVGTVQEEMDQLVSAVRANDYEVTCVNAKDDLDKITAALTLFEPHVIVNLVEYFYDDENLEANVAALFELYDIPYTGSPPLTLATCQRKVRTKILLEDAGVPTPPYFVVRREPVPNPTELDMSYPLIVKPAREDASGGIASGSVVWDYPALAARVLYIFKEFEQPALVEEYIDGREIHAAIVGNKKPEVLPLFEMEFEEAEEEVEGGSEGWRPQIITYNAKWDPNSKAFYSMDSVCPAEELDSEVEEHIRDVALTAYRVMGCRDYARIDMRVDEDGQAWVLEVNPNPDLADGSAFTMCTEASGRTYVRTMGEIVAMALSRRHVEVPKEQQKPVSDHLLRKYGGPQADQPGTAVGGSQPQAGTPTPVSDRPSEPVPLEGSESEGALREIGMQGPPAEAEPVEALRPPAEAESVEALRSPGESGTEVARAEVADVSARAVSDADIDTGGDAGTEPAVSLGRGEPEATGETDVAGVGGEIERTTPEDSDTEPGLPPTT